MKRVYSLSELPSEPSRFVGCTAVIPAAGKGTRLGGSCPKALYVVAGKTLLEWVSLPLMPYCDHFVYVSAPDAADAIRATAEEIVPGRYEIAIQPEAKGMGDAVLRAEQLVHSDICLVTWIDQIAVADATISGCFSLQALAPEASLIMPTVVKPDPYIQFVREERNMRIIEVRQKREGDHLDPIGENDCGLFLFRSQDLFRSLRGSASGLIGRQTEEMNLLPIIPAMESVGDGIFTVRIESESEAVGVNTPQDAEMLAHYLSGK